MHVTPLDVLAAATVASAASSLAGGYLGGTTLASKWTDWVAAGTLADLPADGVRYATIDDEPVILARTGEAV